MVGDGARGTAVDGIEERAIASGAPNWTPPARRVPRLTILLVLAAAILPALLATPQHAAAQMKAVEWARFDVTLDLREDGSYHVTERQQIDFEGGPFRGGFREIPLARTDDIGNVRVSEEAAGGPRRYEPVPAARYDEDPNTYTVQRTTSHLRVEWGFEPAISETRTFLVEYDVIGALRIYLDNDPPNQQIWWTAFGEELTAVAPVREATLKLQLPEAVDVAQTVVAPGEPEDHTSDGRVWTWEASDLTAGEAFEARLQFPPLVQAEVPAWQRTDDERRRREEETEARGAVLNVMFLGAGLLLAIGGGSACTGSGTPAVETRTPGWLPTSFPSRRTTWPLGPPARCSTSAPTSRTWSPRSLISGTGGDQD